MKILVVAATDGEINIFRNYLLSAEIKKESINLLVTGVGMVNTTYALTKELSRNKYDFVLQAGVGGSFDKNIPLGEVVLIASDRYGDLGAEDHENYLDIFEMGLIDPDSTPFTNGAMPITRNKMHQYITLKEVTGLTVNSVSGNQETITYRNEKYKCEIESMEGAAFHHVCIMEGVPFAQVRAISNYVIPRDKSQWQMKEAIINLNNWLIGFIDNL